MHVQPRFGQAVECFTSSLAATRDGQRRIAYLLGRSESYLE